MKKILTKHWSNILFVIIIIVMINPGTKEWVLKTIAFSPSLNSEKQVLSSYNWQLQGLNGESVSFEELQGKVIFVNFWATWCPPCRAELPAIQNLYNAYKNEVVFLFVTHESKEVVKKFFDEHNYDLPVYNSNGMIPAELATTNSIPATYILNKNGEIVISKTGAADWDSDKTKEMINNLLNE